MFSPTNNLSLRGPVPGAMVAPGLVEYCVWAPNHTQMRIKVKRLTGREDWVELDPAGDGYFVATDFDGQAGDRYWFELPDGRLLPDPASRFQPEGVHGPSECIDPFVYQWRCQGWQRPAWRDQIVYELHLGTFTVEGTFRAAIRKLDHVRELGATAIQLMPVADFPGERNWGYDGVALYAPARCYGRPDDFRALVDAAHERGLAVILDVVYNHLGPDGNDLRSFSADYFNSRHTTPWGDGFNFDGPHCGPVRDFFVNNAVYWLDEFRLDGLRLDATHAIKDDSERHVLAEIAEAVHARGGFVIAEDERNPVELLVRPDGRGCRLDAVWSDDFHHQVRVALTGIRESYFGSYNGTADDIVRTLENGWFYIGQNFPFWDGRARGSSCRHLPPEAFVYCIENHDQVGNRARGERLEHLVDPAAFRAASVLLCLSPYPPLLFMGQEWAASTPFLFFTDHAGELGHKVSEGRRKEFAATGLNAGGTMTDVPDPQEEETFVASKLKWSEPGRGMHCGVLELYRECLAQRSAWLQGATDRRQWSVREFDGVVALKFHPAIGPYRLLVVALTAGVSFSLSQDAFLIPPAGQVWRLKLHSDERRFGGEALSQAKMPSDVLLHFDRPAALLWLAEEL